MYSNFDEQRHWMDWVHLHDYDGKPREIKIREAAAEVVRSAETYTPGGMTIVAMDSRKRNSFHYVSENDELPLPGSRTYVTIGPIRLVPELQADPHIAQIIVERIIRPEWP
jgi:hypothetical protein